jgi:hypothetical protein
MWKPKVEDFMRNLRRIFGGPGNDVTTLQHQLMRERRFHAECMAQWEQEKQGLLRDLAATNAKLALHDMNEAPPSPPSPPTMH